MNLLKTNCTSPSLKKTRLQHSLRKKAVVQKPNDNQLKCGPLQHTPALSFKPHPNSATNLTKPSWPFVFQQHPVQWDAWSFLNAAPLKRQGVHFTFQKVTHISFSHWSETVQIIQVCILNNLNIYIWYMMIYLCMYIDTSLYLFTRPSNSTGCHSKSQAKVTPKTAKSSTCFSLPESPCCRSFPPLSDVIHESDWPPSIASP